jgi:hypothetical protein
MAARSAVGHHRKDCPYSVDKSTGWVVWRVPRKTRQAAYTTPVLWDRTIAVAGCLADYVVPTPIVA